MVVQFKTGNDAEVIGAETIFQKAIAKIQAIINYMPLWNNKSKNKKYFSASFSPSFNVIKKINGLKPDIVHLHWIQGGMLKVEDLEKINAPLVWSLHDCWAFTGGCHINWDCENYKKSCGYCPILESNKEIDLSRKIWIRKEISLNKISKLRIVGLSKWMKDTAKQSSLFKDQIIINLPNLINTNKFKPADKTASRLEWALPDDKKLIMFGAIKSDTDINKGYIKLRESILQVQTKNVELVLFGMAPQEAVQNSKFKTHYLGNIEDDDKLVKLFNAVDVMVVPSLQENLSNVIMESLSCATPVVAFDVGGNKDMIEHSRNGYLAKAHSSEDLAYGIDWVLNSKNYNDLCDRARKKVVHEFESKNVANKYTKMYKSILDEE